MKRNYKEKKSRLGGKENGRKEGDNVAKNKYEHKEWSESRCRCRCRSRGLGCAGKGWLRVVKVDVGVDVEVEAARVCREGLAEG